MRLRQIALAAHVLEDATDAFEAVLGIDVAFQDPGVAVFGLENAVMPLGQEFLEVVCPTAEAAPARRYLERRGGDCGYMVMVQTEGWEADRARAEAQGIRVVWEAELPDIRGMHFHPRDTGGALLSLDQPDPPESWRWAGKRWTEHVRTERVVGLRGVTVACLEPGVVAARWGELLDLTPSAGDALPRLDLEDTFIEFSTAASAPEEGVVCVTLRVRDAAAILAAARERGLPTDDTSFTATGTRFRLEAEDAA